MADLPSFVKMGIVVALFLTRITLLVSLYDKWDARRKAAELSNPGQAWLKAERLVRATGELVLEAAHAVLSISSLALFFWLCDVVLEGSWAMLPAVIGLTLAVTLLDGWITQNREALKNRTSSHPL